MIWVSFYHALEERNKTFNDLKYIKKHEQNKRETFLDGLAGAREAAGLEAAGQGVRNMKHRERQRINSRKLKAIMTEQNRGGLSHVDAPDQGRWEEGEWKGTWKQENAKDGREDATLAENNRRFRQANDTIFQQPEIIDI